MSIIASGWPNANLTDVVCIAVEHSNSHTRIKQHLNIFHEVGKHKVACLLESKVDVVVGRSVIQVD